MYHEYCLNYSKAMTYLEQLRKTEEFVEFEKVQIKCLMFHLLTYHYVADRYTSLWLVISYSIECRPAYEAHDTLVSYTPIP